MTMRDYEIICAVYEEASITKAAERLNIAQPTMSNVIRALEKNSGCLLFQRSQAGCYPTDTGRHLYEVAKTILSLDNTAENELDALKTADSFCIGFYTTFGEGPLADLLSYILRRTGYTVQPVVGNYSELFSQVKLKLLDFAFIDYYLYDKDVSAIPIMRDEMILVVSDNYPCSDIITMKELAASPLIVREQGSGDFRTIESCFRDAKYPSKPWGIVSSNAALFSLVRQGHGIACCSKKYFRNDIDQSGLREITLEEGKLSKEGYILVPARGGLNNQKTVIIKAIIQYLQEHNQDGLIEVLPWKEARAKRKRS